MGSHHSQDQKNEGPELSRRNSTRNPVSRSESGSDLQEKPAPNSLVPIEKLTKLLAQRSHKEDGINGVTENSFMKYVFPMYPELARHFYSYLHKMGKCKNKHIPNSTFRLQCEKILAMLDDATIIETYVRMFSSDTDGGMVVPEGFRKLLFTSYKLSMDHYPEGPQVCLMINDTLSAVVNGCFNNKDLHSVGFVVRWLEEHCHKILFPIHRYCVHTLSTRYRDMECREAGSVELATPVLERATWGSEGAGEGHSVLTASRAWLLAGALPPLYSRPARPPRPPPAAAWLARLVCALPSHWTPLYASPAHGLAANRFLHHTLAYRGPTVMLVQSGDVVIVVACPQEWKETHQYWGGPECMLCMLAPTYGVVEHNPKMMYLNTSIRGYPKGLRVGSDPRNPLLNINESFDQMSFKGVPYPIEAIEVWGCGDQESRETQLEIKKWQVKEAERQRQVKLSAADWIEHPDRYLLELAGRPQYNSSAS